MDQRAVKKVVLIQMLNNFSGSPNVAALVARGLVERGASVEVITSRGEGFLSGIEGVTYRYTCYRWNERNKWTTLMRMVAAQVQLFFMVLGGARRDTVYYINTVMPLGAALGAWISGKTAVYHVHENMQQRKPLYGVYRTVYGWCNRRSLFVSHYVRSMAVGCRDGEVVYNALTADFATQAQAAPVDRRRTTVLMVCSLRRFKGVYEFVELARRLPHYVFELVVSDSRQAVDGFVQEVAAPKNLTVYARQSNLDPFYSKAKVLLSLSDPRQCVETFGLTILEAMAYGVPAVVPNAGGPAEIVDDGATGFVLDPHQTDQVAERITELFEDRPLYDRMSEAARKKSANFSVAKTMDQIEQYINL